MVLLFYLFLLIKLSAGTRPIRKKRAINSYNQVRPHQRLNKLSAVQFEKKSETMPIEKE